MKPLDPKHLILTSLPGHPSTASIKQRSVWVPPKYLLFGKDFQTMNRWVFQGVPGVCSKGYVGIFLGMVGKRWIWRELFLAGCGGWMKKETLGILAHPNLRLVWSHDCWALRIGDVGIQLAVLRLLSIGDPIASEPSVMGAHPPKNPRVFSTQPHQHPVLIYTCFLLLLFGYDIYIYVYKYKDRPMSLWDI